MTPITEPETLLRLLDETADGVLLVDGGGCVLHANRPFRRSAELLGLRLEGVFADRLLELADRTGEPYAFAAAVGRLREGGGAHEFEDAALGRHFRLDASAPGGGAAWTLRDVTAERERERVREERIAVVGHELRTPLTAMVGFIELLSDGGAGPLAPEQERYLEIVRRAAERLHALVDELLQRSDPAGAAKGPPGINDVREAG